MKSWKTRYNYHASVIRQWMNELRYYSWVRKPLSKAARDRLESNCKKLNKLEYQKQKRCKPQIDPDYNIYQVKKGKRCSQ